MEKKCPEYILNRDCQLKLDKGPASGFFKGIFQPFELGGMTRLIQSAVKICKAGRLKKKILMIQSHERNLKPISAA